MSRGRKSIPGVRARRAGMAAQADIRAHLGRQPKAAREIEVEDLIGKLPDNPDEALKALESDMQGIAPMSTSPPLPDSPESSASLPAE